MRESGQKSLVCQVLAGGLARLPRVGPNLLDVRCEHPPGLQDFVMNFQVSRLSGRCGSWAHAGFRFKALSMVGVLETNEAQRIGLSSIEPTESTRPFGS